MSNLSGTCHENPLISSISPSPNDQTAHKLVALCHLVESQKSTLHRLTSCLSEADKQRSALLRDLEEERRKNVDLAQKAKELTLSHEKLELEKQQEAEESKNKEEAEVKSLFLRSV